MEDIALKPLLMHTKIEDSVLKSYGSGVITGVIGRIHAAEKFKSKSAKFKIAESLREDSHHKLETCATLSEDYILNVLLTN